MKKYNTPTVQIVELSVKESLSALPEGFGTGIAGMGKLSGATYRNVSIYKKTSAAGSQPNA